MVTAFSNKFHTMRLAAAFLKSKHSALLSESMGSVNNNWQYVSCVNVAFSIFSIFSDCDVSFLWQHVSGFCYLKLGLREEFAEVPRL